MNEGRQIVGTFEKCDQATSPKEEGGMVRICEEPRGHV